MIDKPEPFPEVDISKRIEINAEPDSIEVAKAERYALAEESRRIRDALMNRRSWTAEGQARAKYKLHIVERRASFLKDWIKRQNVAAALAYTTTLCGGDLDNPVNLVAMLRGIILRERAAGRLEWSELGTDQTVLDAATNYLMIMSREKIEAGEG